MTEREAIEQALNTTFEGAARYISFRTLPNGKTAAVASVSLGWRPLSFIYTARVGVEVRVLGGEGGNLPGGFHLFEYDNLSSGAETTWSA